MASFLEGTDDVLDPFFDEFGGGDAIGPRSLRSLAERIADLRRREGVHATFAPKGRGPVVLPTPHLLLRGSARIPLRITG